MTPEGVDARGHALRAILSVKAVVWGLALMKMYVAPITLLVIAALKAPSVISAGQLPDVSNSVILVGMVGGAILMFYQKWNATRREEVVKWDQLAGTTLSGQLATKTAQYEELQQQMSRLKAEYEKRLAEESDRYGRRYDAIVADYEDRLKVARDENAYYRVRIQYLQDQSAADSSNRLELLTLIQKLQDRLRSHSDQIDKNRDRINEVEAKADTAAVKADFVATKSTPITVIPAPDSPPFPVSNVQVNELLPGDGGDGRAETDSP